MASRDTRRRSLAVESTCASSVWPAPPQQPQGVEPALLDRARRPRHEWPAEAGFSISLIELADFGRAASPARAGSGSRGPCVRGSRRKPRRSRLDNSADADHRRRTAPHIFGRTAGCGPWSRRDAPPGQRLRPPGAGSGRPSEASGCRGNGHSRDPSKKQPVGKSNRPISYRTAEAALQATTACRPFHAGLTRLRSSGHGFSAFSPRSKIRDFPGALRTGGRPVVGGDRDIDRRQHEQSEQGTDRHGRRPPPTRSRTGSPRRPPWRSEAAAGR